MTEQGILYIVPTPIGNLDDITERAIKTLSEVAAIAAEDTRHTRKLMQHYGIQNEVFALHEHNEIHRADAVIERLQQGDSLALVSDAGTPLINDPGYVIVHRCREQGLKVIALPGACAVTVALSAAGLPTDRFAFEGFLPSKPQQRRAKLEALKTEQRTIVVYESPHRILHALADMDTVLGNERQVVLARELTKQFETYLRGSAAELLQILTDDTNQQRGEMVLLIAPLQPDTEASEGPGESAKRTLLLLLEELPLKKAAAMTAKIHDERKNLLYQWALENRDNE
ncbi:16S rRNA (cytidine(1402)-2'-O)-methyltransferase [Idiomarina sp. HP20-50]|uniref:16S rRNA (cytidine(1402)-2'-O)-methyltransferase n=1 Tax=Idiomarina sp. HP20-50 TaxID=3070813 RepID=UPI00294B0D8E|nr:16S rRNA (cytidine(1402)-2'-O)-methyltransferase [Idiomarina sp. HP20-50]MDV6315997.1 16S rRNA (cytidine(1402)-2'-O)-methyltransferase [Idiomarina sp. HP20-50]